LRQLDVVDPLTVRFTLRSHGPDFMTFSGRRPRRRGIVLPKKYFESVAPTASRPSPSAPAPTSSQASGPGVEIVLEATHILRHAPLHQEAHDEERARQHRRAWHAQSGETDFALFLDGPTRWPQGRRAYKLVDTRHASIFWIEFPNQWDPSRRGPKAACASRDYALAAGDERGGVPRLLPARRRDRAAVMDFALQVPRTRTTGRRRAAAPEAGYPNRLRRRAEFQSEFPRFSTAGESERSTTSTPSQSAVPMLRRSAPPFYGTALAGKRKLRAALPQRRSATSGQRPPAGVEAFICTSQGEP